MPPHSGITRRGILASAVAVPSVIGGAASARTRELHYHRSSIYRVMNGKNALTVYRRRSALSTGAKPAPVIVLSHGSTFAALTTYDLSVRSGAPYSLMNILADKGFDVWALDHDGYGRSQWSGGNSDIAEGVRDLQAVAAFIRSQVGASKLHFYGQSSGALRVGAFACAHPDSVDHLILESFSWTGEGAPSLAARRRNVAEYRANPRRVRTKDTLAAVFTRDRPDASDREVIDAVIASEAPYGDTVPSGTYLDMSVNLPLVDPAKLTCPVMILRGEFDGNATDADLQSFFERLRHPKRFFIGIAGAAHVILLGRHRAVLHRAIDAFLPPADATDEPIGSIDG